MDYYSRRCALCGQFVSEVDREQLLELDRYEWDEHLVDEARLDAHQCVDTDPYGARQWARLEDAGMLRWTLAELVSLALERRRSAAPPAWALLATALDRCQVARHTPARYTRVLACRVALARCHPARGP